MADLLTALCHRLGTTIDRAGRAHATCPFCASPPGFHFYLYDLAKGRGAVCWACGWRGSLAALARELDVQGTDDRPVRQPVTPPAAPWTRPGALAAYDAAMAARWPEVVKAWKSYKPLSEETIRSAHLGLGKLPLWSEQKGRWYEMYRPRLLAPFVSGGCMVGIAGRALPNDDGPKWITASTSTICLDGLEAVQAGDTVIWCENRIDRLLIQQQRPDVRPVASGGLSWRPEWLQEMKQRRPRHILIMFDNDVAGCPTPATYITMRAAWEQAMRERVRAGTIPRMPPFQEPRGPQLANALLELGLHATCYQWPRGTPHKYDVGSALISEIRQAA